MHLPKQRDAVQVGRRSLLLSGSILGLLADFIVAVVFAVTYTGGANLPESASVASIVLVSDHAWHSNIALSGIDNCLPVYKQTFKQKILHARHVHLKCNFLNKASCHADISLLHLFWIFLGTHR